MDTTPAQILEDVRSRLDRQAREALMAVEIAKLRRLNLYSGWTPLMDPNTPIIAITGPNVCGFRDNVVSLQHTSGRVVPVSSIWGDMTQDEQIQYCFALTRHLTQA